MLDITNELYQQIINQLIEDIGDDGYYANSIEFEHEEILCRLNLSAIIYHKEYQEADNTIQIISDIIPVWWEFHTYNIQGEILNNFSFNELRQLLKY